LEFRQFIKEENAEVREAYLAGPKFFKLDSAAAA
jgi:hypothetical protein